MKPKLDGKQLTELAQYLVGTCNTLREGMMILGWGQMDEEDAEARITVEGEIFCCSCCDWWCDADEARSDGGGEDVCLDCCRQPTESDEETDDEDDDD